MEYVVLAVGLVSAASLAGGALCCGVVATVRAIRHYAPRMHVPPGVRVPLAFRKTA